MNKLREQAETEWMLAVEAIAVGARKLADAYNESDESTSPDDPSWCSRCGSARCCPTCGSEA